MDLTTPSRENLKYILNEIAERLDVANRIIMDEKDYDLDRYDDLKFMFDVIVKKGSLTPQETYDFIDELRAVRKS